MQTYVIKFRAISGYIHKEERLSESYFDASASTCRTHQIKPKDIISVVIKSKKMPKDEE
jgi:hypothetical protein